MTTTAFYVDGAATPTPDFPSPRFAYGLRLGIPFYDALTAGVPFACFPSVTLARLGPTSWRATFSAPVLNTPPLTLPACYVFSPSLQVRQLIPVLDGLGHATAVDIITLEQGPYTYTLTIYGTELA